MHYGEMEDRRSGTAFGSAEFGCAILQRQSMIPLCGAVMDAIECSWCHSKWENLLYAFNRPPVPGMYVPRAYAPVDHLALCAPEMSHLQAR
jgi:hypothetical protein